MMTDWWVLGRYMRDTGRLQALVVRDDDRADLIRYADEMFGPFTKYREALAKKREMNEVRKGIR